MQHLYFALHLAIPSPLLQWRSDSGFHNSLITPSKGSQDTAFLSLQELPSSLPQQSSPCQHPSTPTTLEPTDIDNKTGGRISGLAWMCAHVRVSLRVGEKGPRVDTHSNNTTQRKAQFAPGSYTLTQQDKARFHGGMETNTERQPHRKKNV